MPSTTETRSFRPKGNVSVKRIISSAAPSNVSVSAVLECEDAAGNKFSFSACYFVGELRPYNEYQGLTFSEWQTKRDFFVRNHPQRWRVPQAEYAQDFLMKAYVDGISFDQVTGLDKEK